MKKYINNPVAALQCFQLLRFSTLLLISIAFAKLNLSATKIGEYETFIFLASAVSFFWLNGIIKSLLSLYKNNKTFPKDTSQKKSAEFFNVFVLLLAFSSLTAVIIFSAGNLFAATQKIPDVNLFLIFIILGAPTNLIEYIYLLVKKSSSIITYGIISFILHFALVVSPLILGYPMLYAIWGLIAVTLLRFVWLSVLLVKYSEMSISIPYVKEHIQVGAPLVVSVLLSGAAQYIDGLIISSKYDASTFAVFRYGARELPFAVLLANAFSNAMIPEFSSNRFRATLSKVKNNSRKLMHFLFPITIVLLISANYLYPLVFNKDFIESASIFNIYLLLIVSRLMFPQTILIGLKKTKIIMIASLLEVILNVTLSLIWVNYYGIIGVAFATVVANIFEKLFLLIYNLKTLKIHPKHYIPYKLLLLYSVVTVAIYLLTKSW